MQSAWWMAFAFLAALVETGMGNAGIPVPAFLAAAFCLFVITANRFLLLPLGLLGLTLDIVLCRGSLLTPLLLLAVAAFAARWRRHGDCRLRVLQALPGFVLGLGWVWAAALMENLPRQPGAPFPLAHVVGQSLAAGVAGAVALPVAVAFYDAAAGRLGLPSYRRVQQSEGGAHGA